MTDIEELVRESLRSAPPVVPSVGDPIAAVSGRVRRARRRVAAAVAAVAAVAVAVPLALLGDSSPAAGRLVPAGTPSPAPSRASDGATVWDHNAVAVTAGDGWLWELKRDGSSNGSGHVVKLDAKTHRALQSWAVAAPYDRISYGLERVWVWGGGDGGYPDGLLQIVDPVHGQTPSATVSRPGVGFGGVAFTAGTAWATTGDSVWQINVDGRVLAEPQVGPGVQQIVAVGTSLWVAIPSSNSISQLTANPSGVGAKPGVVEATQDAPLVLLGTFGTDQLIVSNGDDVRTEPVPSNAEGGPGDNGVTLPGAPAMAVELANGDVAAVVDAAERTDGAGVYVIPGSMFRGSPCPSDCAKPALAGENVLSLAVNPAGGVDVVLDDGTAEHWTP